MSGLPNGTYTIRATYIGTTSQAGKVEITIDRADLENVAIVLDGTTGGDDGDYTYEASGKVLDSNGQPAGGAVVYLWTADGESRLVILPLGTMAAIPSAAWPTEPIRSA